MTWTRKHSIPFASVRRLLLCFCWAICAAASSSFAADGWDSVDKSRLRAILEQLNGTAGVGGYTFAAYRNSMMAEMGTFRTYLELLANNQFDDQWLRFFLTGRADGDPAQAPLFKYYGDTSANTSTAQQNLQQFLSKSLGSFWSENEATDFDSSWTYSGVAPSSASMGTTYKAWTVWMAEAMRRLISTNQLIATTHDRNTRAIEENLSLILMQLRDMTNSISVSSPDIPAVSVTNEVTIAADYAPSMPEIALTNISGEVVAASYVTPDTSVFENELELSAGQGNSVLTLWPQINLAGAGVPGGHMVIPAGQIDFNSSQHGGILRNCSVMLTRISTTIWWLLYYLALGVLLRREYVYYTSLGHTEGAA